VPLMSAIWFIGAALVAGGLGYRFGGGDIAVVAVGATMVVLGGIFDILGGN